MNQNLFREKLDNSNISAYNKKCKQVANTN